MSVLVGRALPDAREGFVVEPIVEVLDHLIRMIHI